MALKMLQNTSFCSSFSSFTQFLSQNAGKMHFLSFLAFERQKLACAVLKQLVFLQPFTPPHSNFRYRTTMISVICFCSCIKMAQFRPFNKAFYVSTQLFMDSYTIMLIHNFDAQYMTWKEIFSTCVRSSPTQVLAQIINLIFMHVFTPPN